MPRTADHRETPLGNILGKPRAESDGAMLERAYISTADFRVLAETTDFSFVVGRRGTGKSALFLMLQRYFHGRRDVLVAAHLQDEAAGLILRDSIARVAQSYADARAVARLLWRSEMLMCIAERLVAHSRTAQQPKVRDLQAVLAEVPFAHRQPGAERAAAALQDVSPKTATSQVADVLRALAKGLSLDRLTTAVREALEESGLRAVVMFDGLDEGWAADPIPTAALGGLAKATAEFADSRLPIHPIVFVRDNMFRALASFDPDYSRNIEGSTLRLHWDENALFSLVAQRLRAALLIDADNDTKVWNRFAQRELSNRDGFVACLNKTLHRPRDILVLLNLAYTTANRASRAAIIPDDIDRAAGMISKDRLEDLFKEYDRVFPGLRLMVDVFRTVAPIRTVRETVAMLSERLAASDGTQNAESDFALLRSGEEVFLALFSVGLLGLETTSADTFLFCHDGAKGDVASLAGASRVAIHPCYWLALGIDKGLEDSPVLVEVSDEYQGPDTAPIADMRVRQIGRILTDIGGIKTGIDGQTDFETWVERAVRILFPGRLTNVALHPNANAVQRRDIVATNGAERGFWRRVLDDYDSRQVIFEVKNYAQLGPDDIRQALGYSGRSYGRFVSIVYRSSAEGLTPNERAWVAEMFNQHDIVVFLIPVSVVIRAVSKMRKTARFDYAEDALGKRLDTYVRNYLVTQTGRKA